MQLLFLLGPPAVGKMTIGQEIARRTDLKLLHNHMSIELVRHFFEFGDPHFSKLDRAIRFAIFEEIADSQLEGLIFTLVVAFDEPEDMVYVEEIVSIFAKRRPEVFAVELKASQSTRLERNLHPYRLSQKASKQDTEWSERNLLQWDAEYRMQSKGEELSAYQHVVLDTECLTASESARQIIAFMDHKQSNMTIRLLEEYDVEAVHAVIKAAFAEVPESDQSEPDLVKRLRDDPAYIPDLELVAEMDKKVVGHILLTRVQISTGESSKEALALAPVSVVPELHGRRIGAALIRDAHRRAAELGFQLIALIGHPTYYPKFGYQRASDYGITVAFPVPDEAVMIHELVPGALNEYVGTIRFAEAFGL